MSSFVPEALTLAAGQPPNSASKLLVFLSGTLDRRCPLSKLRGQEHVLKMIWSLACWEWWLLHVQRYKFIPPMYNPRERDEYDRRKDIGNISYLEDFDAFERKRFIDSPFAVVRREISFPPSTFVDKEPLCVNMMPFDLLNPRETLPTYLHQYLPLIHTCCIYNKAHHDHRCVIESSEDPELKRVRTDTTKPVDLSDPRNRIAYLTVDERPASSLGEPQRRGGVHVESPGGAMRSKEAAERSHYVPELTWYHRWGMGRAVDEYLVGGIFLASTAAQSTALWNARVHDTYGDIVGPFGSLERLRTLLGEPDRILQPNELVWLSDRTPHESLPLTLSTSRQFFRLVVGEISVWYADHNTANPTGYSVPPSVPVVVGNKFLLSTADPTQPKKKTICWECGSAEELETARREAAFRELLYEAGVGFIADDLARQLGVVDLDSLNKKFKEAVHLVLKLDETLYSHYTKDFIYAQLSRVCCQ